MRTLSDIVRQLRFLDLVGPNYRVTREGGVAFRLTNRTGAASVKGQVVQFSPDYDDSYIVAVEPYAVIGFVYEAGIANGDPVWVVRDGAADVLVEDGHVVDRDQWLRLSATTPGRAIPQDRPGLDYYAASVTYDLGNGSTIAGSVTSTREDDGVKLQIGGSTVAPSIDARFDFTGLTELPDELVVNGYFAANRAAGVTVDIWDFVAGGGRWVNAGTFPANGTTDITITFTSLTADMLSGGEVWVRLYGADAGTASDYLYIDKLIVRSTADSEHLKELGHTMRAAAAGTDVLARTNIHLL